MRSGLTSIVIPEGVTVIDDDAFSWCENLTSVTLPESIKIVGGNAFAYCPNLETVNLPSHQFNMGGAFDGCDKLPLATQKAITDAHSRNDEELSEFRGAGY